tara:strand:+ start:876 stop:1109 length:234 start_codon:yes stop_codon:yes gene_type:complete
VFENLVHFLDSLVSHFGHSDGSSPMIFDWLMVAVAAAIVIYTFYFGISRTIWPGETDPSHIKYRILNDSDEEKPDAY